MSVQHAVKQLELLGRVPNEDDEAWDAEPFMWAEWMTKVQKPVSDDDARVLCRIFGEDLGYGFGWSILHAVETAPNWPILEAIETATDEWRETMTVRLKNAGLLAPMRL